VSHLPFQSTELDYSLMVNCFMKPTHRNEEICDTLPKNWLAETPQALTSRRLGRQSAERERISEID
ncbi:hypothetical protein, partial [Peribacillus simplex]|uniref:hypothetical protein n=1 Tax=Peribacillus simplex TaxID=1478 RepID=UPI000BD7C4C6